MQKTTFGDEAGNNWRRNSLYFEPEEENGGGETPVVVAAELTEVPPSLSKKLWLDFFIY